MKIYKNLFLLAIFVTAFTVSFAQIAVKDQSTVGKIKGIVTNNTEGRIANVKISIKSKNLKTEVITNELGEYEIELPIGKYKISAEMDGFYRLRQKKVRVRPSEITQLNFTLKGMTVDAEHP